MWILFDQGTPRTLRRRPSGHTIDTAYERGWSQLKNGALLAAAEGAGYDLLLATDKNLRHQQNLAGRRIAIVVLGTTSRTVIQGQVDRIQQAIDNSSPGSYREVPFTTSP